MGHIRTGILLLAVLALAARAWAAPAMMVTVTGTIDDSTATVTVSSTASSAPIPATNSGGTFTAPNVPLEVGPNTVTAVARDPAGNTATLSMTVRVDVTFTIQGTVDEPVANLMVNGKPAVVTGSQFSASVPLQLGLNTLTATATDTAGNPGTQTAEVFVARKPVEPP